MRKLAIGIRWRSSPRRGLCVGHREQLAPPGISRPLSQAQSALSPCSTAAWRNVSRMAATNSKIMLYRCHRPSWNPGKLQPSLRSVINLYAAGFQNVVSAQRNLGFSEN